jgi:hypothetical protein
MSQYDFSLMLARKTAETKYFRNVQMKPLLKPSTVSGTGKAQAQTGGLRNKGDLTHSSSAKSTAFTQRLQGSSELASKDIAYVHLRVYDSAGVRMFMCTGSATNTKLSSSLQSHTFPPPSPATGSGSKARSTRSHHPATGLQTQAINTAVDVDVGCLVVIFSPERDL